MLNEVNVVVVGYSKLAWKIREKFAACIFLQYSLAFFNIQKDETKKWNGCLH